MKRQEMEEAARRVLGHYAAREHIVEHDAEGAWHPTWIPEQTSERCYISRGSALALTEPWEGAEGPLSTGAWTTAVDGADHAHVAMMSSDEPYADAARDVASLFATEGLYDARAALRFVRHPAGERDAPVWAASHARAIIERAWGECLDLEDDAGTYLARVVTPMEVARTLRSREQWTQLHAMARGLAERRARSEATRAAWTDWASRQCPDAHFTRPDARWRG